MGENIMIERFTVYNYKGFNEEIVLDLSKTRDYAFNPDLIKNGLVNKGIIYGKNGSGKSNLGFALYDLTTHLTDKQKPSDIFTTNYINLDNEEDAAVFTYEFKFGNDRITYTYAKRNINHLAFEIVKLNNEVVVKHVVYNDEKTIVKIKGAENLRIDLLDPNLSILKYIYKNTPADKDSPVTKIVEFAEKMLWFRCLSEGTSFIGYIPGSTSMDEIIINNNKLEDFQKFLLGNDLKYELFVKNVNNSNYIYAKFKNGEALFSTIISTGTRALWVYYCWSIYFENISFLFLDEFDAFYHYETAEMVIKAINNNKNMQAIVTSHNTYLMRNSITRPDCCFILTNNKVTALCDCTDKEIREAHNLEKMYRNGAFQE